MKALEIVLLRRASWYCQCVLCTTFKDKIIFVTNYATHSLCWREFRI